MENNIHSSADPILVLVLRRVPLEMCHLFVKCCLKPTGYMVWHHLMGVSWQPHIQELATQAEEVKGLRGAGVRICYFQRWMWWNCCFWVESWSVSAAGWRENNVCTTADSTCCNCSDFIFIHVAGWIHSQALLVHICPWQLWDVPAVSYRAQILYNPVSMYNL